MHLARTRGLPVRRKLVITLGALTALGPLTFDTYLPALPRVARELDATSGAVGFTLSGALLGFAIGQLLAGPLSDAVGRRRPMLVGAGLHVVASILCAIAPNVIALSVFRVIQGMAASACAVVAMAVARDVASGHGFVVLISRLSLVSGVAPVLAPTLGSQILRWTDWRGVFVVLAGLGALLLVLAAVSMPETLEPTRQMRGGWRTSRAAYGVLLRDRSFVGLMGVAGLLMLALFAWVSGSSFVLQQQFGLSVQGFGLAFGGGSISIISGMQLNPWLVKSRGSRDVLAGALLLGSVAAAAQVALAVTGLAGLWGVLGPTWCFMLSAGIALPNAPALALAGQGERAGTAAALLGSTQFAMAGLIGPLFGVVGVSAVTMAAILVSGQVLALAVLLVVVRPRRLRSESTEPAYGFAH